MYEKGRYFLIKPTLRGVRSESKVCVIYDGQCQFCEQSVRWIEQRLQITALQFQSADLAAFNLTREQCAKQVFVISGDLIYGGADAIAFLLNQRGNRVLAKLITASGAVGRAAYRWIAGHRGSWLVKIATKVLSYLNR
jgi:predicted DCC family thiol-disulfide oxidoreductase YuxK